MSTTTESSPDFPAYRSILEYLYWDQGKTLSEVIKTMKDEYGFVARYNSLLLLGDKERILTAWSLKTYKEYLVNKWGMRKYATEDESFSMLEIRRRRRIEENKETEFTRLDRAVDDKNLDLFAKRHNWEMDSSSPLPEIRGTIHYYPYHFNNLADTGWTVATPPNIRYRTPDLDTTNPSPPANTPYPRSTASEEQAPVDESFGRHRAHALQSGDMPPNWQFDGDAFAGPQSSNHASVPIQLTTSLSPGHPISHASQGFPQNGTGPMFSRSPYQDHDELPSHSSNVLVGEVSSWGYNSPLPPLATQSPGFGMYPSATAFPSDYTQRIDQGTIAVTSFYDGTQPLGAIHSPGLALRAPGNIPLQDIAVGSDTRFSGAMLHDGVDPSPAIPFPHTNEAMRRAEDDKLDVLDTMIVWPNNRARRM
jgi:hypothetical protein